ncbi:hypothetical protein Tco_0529448 [Tanacetum coccineum]
MGTTYQRATRNLCSRSGPINCTWDDEISNEGGSSHNHERKSQTARNSYGAPTRHPLPKAENVKVAIYPKYLEQSIMLGGGITDEGKKAMCDVLKDNLDAFAWKPADMTGVPRMLDEHKPGVKERIPPVRQKKRGQAPERSKVVNEEVLKLVDVG